jgi:hypothetical protein
VNEVIENQHFDRSKSRHLRDFQLTSGKGPHLGGL